MPGTLLYLDSSAIVKLVVAESETDALLRLLPSWPERVSSVLARVEVERAARKVRRGLARRASVVLDRLALIELDDAVIREAAALQPPDLRTLDAIHLATALSLGGELGALCGYDARLTDAAALAGIQVLSPS